MVWFWNAIWILDSPTIWIPGFYLRKGAHDRLWVCVHFVADSIILVSYLQVKFTITSNCYGTKGYCTLVACFRVFPDQLDR